MGSKDGLAVLSVCACSSSRRPTEGAGGARRRASKSAKPERTALINNTSSFPPRQDAPTVCQIVFGCPKGNVQSEPFRQGDVPVCVGHLGRNDERRTAAGPTDEPRCEQGEQRLAPSGRSHEDTRTPERNKRCSSSS